MTNTLFILGNLLDDQDALPVHLLPKLQQHFPTLDCVLFDPTEELPAALPPHICIVDTVIGIDTITVFSNLEDFKLSPRVSVHDFDLPLFLGLLKKLGKIEKITIIGIPSNNKEPDVLPHLMSVIENLGIANKNTTPYN
jgi:Ni,Fe-hydrogenase maturation factor